jgi:hypothetical protein
MLEYGEEGNRVAFLAMPNKMWRWFTSCVFFQARGFQRGTLWHGYVYENRRVFVNIPNVPIFYAIL